MELTHRFTVPLPVAETWEAFEDIASLAECFPGATVTSADGDSFAGSVKVKLGPIALVYNGSGTFVEKDAAAHSFLVDAKGKDKRGNGTAGAKVTVTMADAGGAATEVAVATDLAITGKPAQFGRGVMQDVSDKLLAQFVACLEQRFAASEPASEPTAVEAPAEKPAEEPTPVADSAAAATRPATAPRPTPSAGPAGPAAPAAGQGGDDALDLGAAVVPVLLKSYWKPALAGAAAVLVVWRLVRR